MTIEDILKMIFGFNNNLESYLNVKNLLGIIIIATAPFAAGITAKELAKAMSKYIVKEFIKSTNKEVK